MKTEFMVEGNTTNSASYANFPGGIGNDQFRLREAFVQVGNVLESQPDAKFWAGERYYRRQHIDIDDFYPLDMSGYGAGVEDLDLRLRQDGCGVPVRRSARHCHPKRLSCEEQHRRALLRPEGTCGSLGRMVRFRNLERGRDRRPGTVIPTTDGYAVGLRHQRLEWHGGYHAFSIQYGTGAASNFSTSIDDPTPFLHSAARLLVTEQVLFQPNDRFAIMPIFVYQRTKDGNPQHGWNQWVSFGARPEIFFTKHLSLAFEGGFDHTHSQSGQYDGWLRKFTIAPQIGAGSKFFSRPVLRAFLTYANWSDGLRGFVGGVPYLNRTNGLTYGVQAETWF